MALGTAVVKASGTLPVTGPGEISSVAVTATGTATTDHVSIQFTSDIPVDVLGTFQFKVVPTTNVVTVTANRSQLPTAVTFNVFVWNTA